VRWAWRLGAASAPRLLACMDPFGCGSAREQRRVRRRASSSGQHWPNVEQQPPCHWTVSGAASRAIFGRSRERIEGPKRARLRPHRTVGVPRDRQRVHRTVGVPRDRHDARRGGSTSTVGGRMRPLQTSSASARSPTETSAATPSRARRRNVAVGGRLQRGPLRGWPSSCPRAPAPTATSRQRRASPTPTRPGRARGAAAPGATR
jgi:hypothetical protein